MSVIAIIPARSGSKSLPHKNIRSFRGTPLLSLAVQQAVASQSIDQVIVSTDDAHYAEIARAAGAEVPFLRPPALAGDLSTDLEVFTHALEWYRLTHSSLPDLVAHVRPTYPNRTTTDIDGAVALLLAHPEWDSVRSVSLAPESPLKMWWKHVDGTLEQVATAGIRESHSMPRQALPTAWLQNACIDVMRPTTILEKRSMVGDTVGAYVMDHHHDIDNAVQFDAAVDAASGIPSTLSRAMVVCMDIDGVIATISPGNDYALARPQQDVIDAVNLLHEVGHRIILFTARGSATGIDWSDVTRSQMVAWGVRHHELRFGKPAADVYVDDRATGIASLVRLAHSAAALGKELP